MNEADALRASLDRLQRRALTAGGGLVALCLVGAFTNPAQFFRSYLLGFLFAMGFALGCLATLMLAHLMQGNWGVAIQRILEAGTRTLPVMALLFLPLLAGFKYLYLWARPEAVAADELLHHKAAYLNVPFFVERAALYFALWLIVARFLNKWSAEQDRTTDPVWSARLQNLCGPGIVIYGLTATFASIDWAMSLQPHWFSTAFGILFMVSQCLSAFSLAAVVASRLADRPPLRGVITSAQFHDLGNLLLTFVMLWAYIAFAQFLIIWAGNLPEEIPWYLSRLNHGWAWVALLLILFHFAVPFVLLLNRPIKKDPRKLAVVAACIIFMRFVDLYWIVEPAFHPGGFYLHWMDLLLPAGIVSIWLGAFLWQLKRRPLLPLNDPRMESLLHPAEAE